MKFSRVLVVIALLIVIGSGSLPVIAKNGTDTPDKPPIIKDPGKGGALTQDYG